MRLATLASGTSERGFQAGLSLPFGRGLVLAALLLLHGGLLVSGAIRQSPTSLEPAFLVAGISHWKFRRFELFRVNPPLPRLLAAIPVMVYGYKLDWLAEAERLGPRPEHGLGRHFISVNDRNARFLFVLARCACIPFGLLGLAVAWKWAFELYGPLAGLLAGLLWCFEPTIVAHGALITADVPAASTGLLASYAFYRWLMAPTLPRAFAAGASLGLSLLCKFTWLILVPLWPLMCLLWTAASRPRASGVHSRGRCPVHLALMYVCALYVVNCGYFFSRPLVPLRDFSFVSQLLTPRSHSSEAVNRFADTWIGCLPVPLPEQFVVGIDIQYRDFESFGPQSYLAGTWRNEGWWYYYLYGLLVKTPHGAQFLAILAAVLLCRQPRHTLLCISIAIVLPMVAVLLAASSQQEFNHHFRYILPAISVATVFSASVLSPVALPVAPVAKTLYRLLVMVSVLDIATQSFQIHPYGVRYFNPLSGGSASAYKHLCHSSLDWGQENHRLLEIWSRRPELVGCRTRLVGSYVPDVAQEFYREGQPHADSREYTVWSKSVYMEQFHEHWNTSDVILEIGPLLLLKSLSEYGK